MNVADIRDQLAAALRVTDIAVAKHRTDPVSGFPAAIIGIDTINGDTFQDESYTISCTITVLASKADLSDAWTKLDQLLSDDTLAGALLAAECVTAVGAYSNIGIDIEYGTGLFLGFTIAVEVLA